METVNQEAKEPEAKVRTFTQDEVNAIVEDRLRRDRGDRADYDILKEKAERLDAIEEASKTELQKANEKVASLQAELDGIKAAEAIRTIRDKVAQELEIPASLLTGDTEEACRTQAEAIKAYARPKSAPRVKDGGEPGHAQGQSTRQQFADWLNAQ